MKESKIKGALEKAKGGKFRGELTSKPQSHKDFMGVVGRAKVKEMKERKVK